jgi:hypothetical protein
MHSAAAKSQVDRWHPATGLEGHLGVTKDLLLTSHA